jgi:hypothetical protein
MRSKDRITNVLLICLFLLIGFLGFQFLTYSFWEATLTGPFQGAPYTGELSSNTPSILKLSRGGQLELHEISGLSPPVFALRRGDKVEWQQAIPVQRFSDGKEITHTVRDAKLQKTVFWLARGTKVLFTCDWTGGGYEGGLIYLKPDQSLDHFGISW